MTRRKRIGEVSITLSLGILVLEANLEQSVTPILGATPMAYRRHLSSPPCRSHIPLSMGALRPDRA